MINSGLPVVCHDHTLACCQPVVLDHIRRPEHIKSLINLATGQAVSGASRRHTRGRHDLLGKGLAAFQPRRGRGGAEACDAVRAYRVGNTCHQGRLGSDDDQIDSEPGGHARHGSTIKHLDGVVGAQRRGTGVARRSMEINDRRVAAKRQGERVLSAPRADHQRTQTFHHVPKAYRSAQWAVALRFVADPSFPALHIRPPHGWLNDPNGLCRLDGRYHVFFQYNPQAPVHGAIHWGHVSSIDLLHWQEHPIALTPRVGLIDQAGCWTGCVVDDGEVPTAVYTATPDHARNAVVALARSDRSLIHWRQDEAPVTGISSTPGPDEVRDPFVFIHDGRRYAVQGAGQAGGSPRLLLYGCDDLTRWTELGTLVTTDDPIAAQVASTEMWECPNLVHIDGQWVLLLSLCHMSAGFAGLRGVRYLIGDLVAHGPGLTFKAASGGVLDTGPAFFAPQVLAEPHRTLLWAWAPELGRSADQIADAGWAGVLTFPRELFVRDGVLGVRPAAELVGLRREPVACLPGAPFQEHAFELVAEGPVTLGLIDEGVDALVSYTEGTPDDPARIMVDGSIVETFQGGASHTTRAYPSPDSRWAVDGEAVTAYRLGDMAAGPGRI
jgi:beta-fructofuranosidase